MGRHKRLTEKQREFARLVVTNRGKMTNTNCAIEAGYSEKRATVEASELQKQPLVKEYIEQLREQSFEDNKLAINKILEEFYYLLQDARKKLGEDYKKGNYRRVVITCNKFKEVFEYIGYGRSEMTVYLAEETRPYKTYHYKIGKTENCLQSRSTGRTDNPFGLNYVASFTYIPSNGFNLEKTLHSFFRNFSTYNEKYNTSASEWFSIKNKNTIIKNFKKIGLHLLNKNGLFHKYEYHGDKGYFK